VRVCSSGFPFGAGIPRQDYPATRPGSPSPRLGGVGWVCCHTKGGTELAGMLRFVTVCGCRTQGGGSKVTCRQAAAQIPGSSCGRRPLATPGMRTSQMRFTSSMCPKSQILRIEMSSETDPWLPTNDTETQKLHVSRNRVVFIFSL